jgi:large subunit ribosomal protein L47
VKVEDSMENLEEVVKERNRAYYELETGTTGFSRFFSKF